MIDPRIASLLSPKAKFNAGLRALGELSSQLVNRGAPRLSPTPPPMNLGRVMDAYNSTIQNDMQRGLAMHQFKRSEDEYARKQQERDAISNMLAPVMRPVTENVLTDVNQDGADIIEQRTTMQQTPSALMQTLPAALRPSVAALAQAGQGPSAISAILAAAVKPQAGSSLMKEAQLLYPNDPAAQKAFIEKARKSAALSIEMKNNPANIVATVAGEGFKEAAAQVGPAGQKLFQLNEMENLISSGAPTGKVADATLGVRKILSDFGYDDPSVPIQTAIRSLGRELALSKHGPGMGPMTDADFVIYQSIVPKMGNTVGGNNLLLKRLKREYLGQQMYARGLQRQLLSPAGAAAYDPAAAWREVAAELDRQVGPLVPKFATQADFQKTGNTYVGQIVSVAGQAFEVKP